MAKHKFIKPSAEDGDEKEARTATKKTATIRASMAAKGKDLPGEFRSKGAVARMKSRYGEK